MCSASRNEQLERILTAKYDLECCDYEDKAECSAMFEKLISEALEAHPTVSRGDLIEAINFKYHEFKAARISAQRKRETL